MKPHVCLMWCMLLAPLTPAAMAEPATAPDLLGQIPAIPSQLDALHCETARQVSRRAEEVAARLMTQQAQAAMMPATFPTRVTDAQGEALEHMSEERLSQCLMDVSTAAHEQFNVHLDAFRQQLNALQQKRFSDDNGCGSGIGMDEQCHHQVMRHYRRDVRDQVTRFLTKAKPPFEQWRQQARQCIELREQAADGVIKSGMSGPFALQAQGMITQNYALVKAVADAHGELCDNAFKAIEYLDEQR